MLLSFVPHPLALPNCSPPVAVLNCERVAADSNQLSSAFADLERLQAQVSRARVGEKGQWVDRGYLGEGQE